MSQLLQSKTEGQKQLTDEQTSDLSYISEHSEHGGKKVRFETVKDVQEYVDEIVPANYFLKINSDVEELMLKLDKHKLKRCQKIWDENPDGLELGPFVKLMMDEISGHTLDEKLQNMHDFIKYFQSVDINGDGSMEWSELIQQIIDTVTTESIKRTVDSNNKDVEIAQILKLNADQEFDRYARNGKTDFGSHKRRIAKVVFCEEVGNGANKPHTEQVIHSEECSTQFGIYSTDMKPLKKVSVPLKVEHSVITSICFRDMSNESSNYCPVGTNSLIAITSTDAHIHIYTQIKRRLEYWKSIPTEQIQDRIWCLEHSKRFITTGMHDFALREWNFSPFMRNAQVGEAIHLHTAAVTDLVEINHPPSIITCSNDKTIKMYNLDRNVHIRTFTQHHTNGVQQLKYLRGFNQLLSRGFEVFVNIWNPENLYGDPFVGQFKGHSKPVVSIDDIKGQPYVVSLDLTGNIIIWDIRTQYQLQNIRAQFTKSMGLQGVFCFNKRCLWFYGMRFFEFDKLQFNEVERQEEVYPQHAFYNAFFNSICVLYGNQLKLYTANDGRLNVLHQNLCHEQGERPLAIDLDKRHRKIYVASTSGQIQVMDVQSGVTLKYVHDDKNEEDNGDQKKDKKQRNQEDSDVGDAVLKKIERQKLPAVFRKKKKVEDKSNATQKPSQRDTKQAADQKAASRQEDKDQEDDQTFMTQIKQEGRQQSTLNSQSKEIVCMQLVWEEEMIQLIYCDKKTIYIYNEEDDESKLLRSMTGANLDDNITRLRFDYHLSLIATGSDKGRVAVWDYEMGKLLGVCVGHDNEAEITGIEFCAPYPMMITCGTDGKILLWTVRPVPFANCHVCVASFQNITFNCSIEENCAVQSLCIYKGDMTGIEKGYQLFHYLIPASTYRDYITTQVLALQEESLLRDEKGKFRGPLGIFNSRIALLQEYSTKDKFDGLSKTEREFQRLKKDPPYSVKGTGLNENYDDEMNLKMFRFYVYVGDSLGSIKLLDFTHVISSLNIDPVATYTELKPTFIPVRKEQYDVSKYSEQLIKHAESCRFALPKPIPCNGIIIREVLGHQGSVKKLTIHEQGGILSCSLDNSVHVWSTGLDLRGILNQKTNALDKLWHFPQANAKQKVEEDLQQMQELLEEVGLSDQVGQLVADSDFKEEGHEEGIHHTLERLYKIHEQVELFFKEKQEQKRANRELEKQEWLKMMSGDRKEAQDTKVEFKPTFNKIQWKIDVIQQFMKQLDEDEKRLLDPHAETSITIRPNVGLTKRLNDKLQAMIDHERHREHSTDAHNDHKSPRRMLKTRLTMSDSPSKSPMTKKTEKLVEKSPEKSPVKTLQLSSELQTAQHSPSKFKTMPIAPRLNETPENTDSNYGTGEYPTMKLSQLESLGLELHKEQRPQIIVEDEEAENAAERASALAVDKVKAKRTLDQLNKTIMIEKKIKLVKGRKEAPEANPVQLEKDRATIKLMKNVPSLRQELQSIKTARQRVVESEHLMFMRKANTHRQHQSVEPSYAVSRNQSQVAEAYQPSGRPGHKFHSILGRNESSASLGYEPSVHKYLKERVDYPQTQHRVAANSSNVLQIDQQRTARFPGQFASQLHERQRLTKLHNDFSIQHLASYAQGEILIDQDGNMNKVKTPLRMRQERRLGQGQPGLDSHQFMMLAHNDSAKILSDGSFQTNTQKPGEHISAEMSIDVAEQLAERRDEGIVFLPKLNVGSISDQVSIYQGKTSNYTNPYGGQTSASNRIKQTADGSNSHDLSIGQASPFQMKENSAMHDLSIGKVTQESRRHSTFLPNDPSIQHFEAHHVGREPNSSRLYMPSQESAITLDVLQQQVGMPVHKKFSYYKNNIMTINQAPPTLIQNNLLKPKFKNSKMLSQVRAIHTLEYIDQVVTSRNHPMLTSNHSISSLGKTISAKESARTSIEQEQSRAARNWFTERAKSYTLRKEKYIGKDSILMQAQRLEQASIEQQRLRIAELKSNIKL